MQISLKGPYSLGSAAAFVPSGQRGVYAFSRDGRTCHYVGRSDTDLAGRIVSSALEGIGYNTFWYAVCTSPRSAYLSECNLYHRFRPPENSVHPAVPPGQSWHCPVNECHWS